jgi:hypothetical protein
MLRQGIRIVRKYEPGGAGGRTADHAPPHLREWRFSRSGGKVVY